MPRRHKARFQLVDVDKALAERLRGVAFAAWVRLANYNKRDGIFHQARREVDLGIYRKANAIWFEKARESLPAWLYSHCCLTADALYSKRHWEAKFELMRFIIRKVKAKEQRELNHTSSDDESTQQ